MPNTDDHHNESYEDGEPPESRIAAYAYTDWGDGDAYSATDPKHPDYHDFMSGYSDDF